MEQWKLYDRDDVGYGFDEDLSRFSPIGSLDTQPGIYDHIKLNGRIYVCGQIDHVNKIAVIKQIEIGEEHDTEYTGNAVCPHCGYDDADCFEWEEEGDQQCGRCGLPFNAVRNVEITYTTEKIGSSNKKYLNAV